MWCGDRALLGARAQCRFHHARGEQGPLDRVRRGSGQDEVLDLADEEREVAVAGVAEPGGEGDAVLWPANRAADAVIAGEVEVDHREPGAIGVADQEQVVGSGADERQRIRRLEAERSHRSRQEVGVEAGAGERGSELRPGHRGNRSDAGLAAAPALEEGLDELEVVESAHLGRAAPRLRFGDADHDRVADGCVERPVGAGGKSPRERDRRAGQQRDAEPLGVVHHARRVGVAPRQVLIDEDRHGAPCHHHRRHAGVEHPAARVQLLLELAPAVVAVLADDHDAVDVDAGPPEGERLADRAEPPYAVFVERRDPDVGPGDRLVVARSELFEVHGCDIDAGVLVLPVERVAIEQAADDHVGMRAGKVHAAEHRDLGTVGRALGHHASAAEVGCVCTNSRG